MAGEAPTDETVAPATAEAPAEDTTNKTVDGTKYTVTKTDDGNTVLLASDKYTLRKYADNYGRDVLDISKRGWVGPAPLSVSPDDVGELVALFKSL